MIKYLVESITYSTMNIETGKQEELYNGNYNTPLTHLCLHSVDVEYDEDNIPDQVDHIEEFGSKMFNEPKWKYEELDTQDFPHYEFFDTLEEALTYFNSLDLEEYNK